MKNFIKLITLMNIWVGLTLSCQALAAVTSAERKILLSRTENFLGERQPYATAGAIPYTVFDDRVYIQLGKEAQGGADKKGLFCPYIGKYESTDTSFLAAALRELRQESAGLYTLSEEEVLETAPFVKPGLVYSFFPKKNKIQPASQKSLPQRDIVTFFFKTDHIYTTEDLQETQAKLSKTLKDPSTLKFYLEKDELVWVLVNDLLDLKQDYDSLNRSVRVRNIYNESFKLRFRPHFIRRLLDENFRQKLHQISSQSSPLNSPSSRQFEWRRELARLRVHSPNARCAL